MRLAEHVRLLNHTIRAAVRHGMISEVVRHIKARDSRVGQGRFCLMFAHVRA